MKIGMGYDIHRLVEGRPMIIGGVDIPYARGPLGHSDGDVLLHAICDAILGAIGKGDIGMIFPDTDPKYKDMPSSQLLSEVRHIMDLEGYEVRNVDCVVIVEEPKLAPYRERISGTIGDLLRIPKSSVGVKAKTAEKLGEIGKGEAIAAHAVILLKETK
ncbi:2-C-methyl-D-erythritol 2,4-cyclodiphosphate synthase [Candidatus Omnitrophota bacterium]